MSSNPESQGEGTSHLKTELNSIKVGGPPPISPSARLRMAVVLRILRKLKPQRLVEVGPGIGGASWHLARYGQYLGFEPDQASFQIARQRLSMFPDAAVVNKPLPETDSPVSDVVVALEVLEHIEDDVGALRMWSRWVVPGGFILLSVPAKQERFGPWDAQVGHFRRYEKAQLIDRMAEAGLINIHVVAYGMPIGYLLDWTRNRLLARRLTHVSGTHEQTDRSGRSFQPMRGATLINLLTQPFVLIQRPFESTRFGIGWVAYGQRR